MRSWQLEQVKEIRSGDWPSVFGLGTSLHERQVTFTLISDKLQVRKGTLSPLFHPTPTLNFKAGTLINTPLQGRATSQGSQVWIHGSIKLRFGGDRVPFLTW